MSESKADIFIVLNFAGFPDYQCVLTASSESTARCRQEMRHILRGNMDKFPPGFTQYAIKEMNVGGYTIGGNDNMNQFIQQVISVKIVPLESSEFGGLFLGDEHDYAFELKCLEGHSIYVNLARRPADANITIDMVKRFVWYYDGIEVDAQRMIYQGEQLIDDKQTLEKCGIYPSSDTRANPEEPSKPPVVYIVLRLRGGGYQFADLADDAKCTNLTFNSAAPRWRICSEGLNLEGVCTNASCAAYNKMVIDPQGYGTCNIVHHTGIKCPMCNTSITAKTCGLVACHWKACGVKSDGTVVNTPVKRVTTGYDRYSDNIEDSAEWSSLVIFTATKMTNFQVDDVCSICLDSLDDEEGRHLTSCGHTFHTPCFKVWSKKSASCPYCRTRFD